MRKRDADKLDKATKKLVRWLNKENRCLKCYGDGEIVRMGRRMRCRECGGEGLKP